MDRDLSETSLTPAEMLAEYKRQAALGQFQGLTILQYEQQLHQLCVRYEPKTLLDYGSGHGKAWSQGLTQRLGLAHVTCYDPALPAFAYKPKGHFDAVACVDVLEHIPRGEVEQTIVTLFLYATKFVFATVCCRPAKKCFPDMTNMHVTIEPFDWWWDHFERYHTCKWSLQETP